MTVSGDVQVEPAGGGPVSDQLAERDRVGDDPDVGGGGRAVADRDVPGAAAGSG